MYINEQALDLHLIREVQKGNKHAFDTLVVKYQYRIYKVVAHYISDPSEVLDVTQETFIKAYRAMGKFRGDSAFYTWLYRIATNTAKNYAFNSGRRLPENTFKAEGIELLTRRNSQREMGTPEHLALRDEIQEVIFEVIEHLPEDLKTTILLREIEGLSYDEIAAQMKCPVGTVRSRIFRARESIDKKLLPLLQQ